MKVICNEAREDCEGCRHSIPHEPQMDEGTDQYCDSHDGECVFQEILTKCIPAMGGELTND